MSVKVRLNNRDFFGGNSVIVGSRLFEEDATVQTPTAPANNASTGQQPDMAQKIGQVINGGFQALVNHVSQNVQQIQGPSWPQAPQQLQGSTEEVLKAVQGYLQGVINVVKEYVSKNQQNASAQNSQQQAQQLQSAPTAQQTSGQPAQNQTQEQ